MGEITSVTKEVPYRLGQYLRQQLPELEDVILDWPEPNEELTYPSLSITTGAPMFTPLSHGDIIRINQSEAPDERGQVWWAIGEYDFDLQLDLWTQSKEQRHVLYERLFNAFHSQLPVMGLSLVLEGYHGIWCRYDQDDYSMEETEDQAQRQEWRVRLSVLAHTEAISLKDEYLIKTAELHFDTFADDEEVS